MIKSTSAPADGPESAARPAVLPQVAPPVSNWSAGVRETIESVAIAFALAFLFKTFEAEAFVIPTGSMAPTLMGRHKDVVCPKCGYRYSASGSDEAERDGTEKRDPGSQVVSCLCPICRYRMSVDPQDAHNVGRDAHPSYSGDRIWVSKVPYQLLEPRRWDVIVFRFPEEAETYYIKRLVGLPNEEVKILHGDIYTKGADDVDFVVQRKPPEKLRAMAQIVHDNDYVSTELIEHSWPSRWQVWSEQEVAGDWQPSEDTRSFSTDGKAEGESWIRYQHILPSESDWSDWRDDREPTQPPRSQLITDFYAFNARVVRKERYPLAGSVGMHWVGDLILDCELDVKSSQGTVLLDLVKGGRRFRCTIDVASGRAELTIDGLVDWKRTATTALRGVGKHRVMFANADRQLVLWIDDKVVSFDQPTEYEDLKNDRPQAGGRERGDLAPVGIGSRGAALAVNHLRVLRDIYYVADTASNGDHTISDFHYDNLVSRMSSSDLADFFATPAQWENGQGVSVFDRRQEKVFPLLDDQFFVLGDNSPASFDARLWREHFVPRDLLVGKALFIYWPHPLELFIPFTDKSIGIIPNFRAMGFIR
jgi:signal peptidase I